MRNRTAQRGQGQAFAVVEDADKSHEIMRITRHGHPSAVLVSARHEQWNRIRR
ncbi:type II toxin-antitoxin system Phd/YefM family antitoxin [Pseudarthrobacter sp. CC12]|uniref:type II toxin-antitoxin system Phd/YefM family antitoxin n=1 Tax=Pseudarthrobacter sp. CC12 TaxID=3029193 RepID=UPI00326737F5